MPGKVKIQHYVPKAYLRYFTQDNRQLFVYDKSDRRVFQSSIDNIAAEKRYYDVPGDSAQTFEQALGNLVDSNYPKCAEDILNNIDSGRIVRDWQKENLAFFIALQALRTRRLRNQNIEALNQLGEAFSHLSRRFEKEYGVKQKPDASLKALLSTDKEKTAKLDQLTSMIDSDSVRNIIGILLNHVWIFGTNKTDRPFYTSDNPVAKWPHKTDPVRSYWGLRSEGIEIAFPLTPKHIVVLVERSFHSDLQVLDGWFMPIDENGVVYYNSFQVLDSNRWLFSISNDFTLAEDMLDEIASQCLSKE